MLWSPSVDVCTAPIFWEKGIDKNAIITRYISYNYANYLINDSYQRKEHRNLYRTVDKGNGKEPHAAVLNVHVNGKDYTDKPFGEQVNVIPWLIKNHAW